MSDSEVITVALIIETFFQGHEEVGYAFVCQYLGDLFRHLLDLDRFNSRRRHLVGIIEAIRRKLRNQIIDQGDRIRIVDSAPITLMTYTRGSRCKTVLGSEYFGVVTSKKGKFFGLRLHATVTAEQLIDEWLLAPASATDAKVLDELVLDCRDLSIIATKPTMMLSWKNVCGVNGLSTSCLYAKTIKKRNGLSKFVVSWVGFGIGSKLFSAP